MDGESVERGQAGGEKEMGAYHPYSRTNIRRTVTRERRLAAPRRTPPPPRRPFTTAWRQPLTRCASPPARRPRVRR